MKSICYLIYSCFIFLFFEVPSLKAQVIEVLSMEEERYVEAQYCVPVFDSNNEACALVHIVGLDHPGFIFEGNVTKVQSAGKEYYLSVPSGTRRIRVKHTDYWPIEVDFRALGVKLISGRMYKLELRADKLNIEEDVATNTKGTFLSVKTLPYGSDIFLDGIYVGQTPWVSKVKKGVHSLEISKVNYISMDTTLDIVKNTATNVTGLLPKIESLCFNSNAPRCQIWIDGANMGMAEDSIKVTVGVHHARLHADGYYDFNDSILISPNQNQYEIYMYKKFCDFKKAYKSVDYQFEAIEDSLCHDYYCLKTSLATNNITKTLAEDDQFFKIDQNNMSNIIKALRLSQILTEPISHVDGVYKVYDYSDKILAWKDVDEYEFQGHKTFLKGVEEFRGRDYVNAFRMFKSAWDKGYTEDDVISALTWMGFEIVIKIPNQKAANRYSELAGMGFPQALFVMGWLYENGLYYSKDFGKAKQMYVKAASMGDRASLWQLGWMWENGLDGNRDERMAAYYYSLAETAFREYEINGIKITESAHYAIEGELANKFSVNELSARGNAGKDTINQICLKEAAHLGNIDAMRETLCVDAAIIGDETSMLYSASVVEKRFIPFFLQELAQNNNAKACEYLGRYYGEEKIDSCLYWLKKAVDLGDINAVQYQERIVSKMVDINDLFEQKYYIAINEAFLYDEPYGKISEHDEFYRLSKGDTICDGGGVNIDEDMDWLWYSVHGGYGGYFKKSDFYTKIYKCSYLISTDFIRRQGLLKFVANDGRSIYIFEVNRNGYQIRDWDGKIINDTLFAVLDEYGCLVYLEENGYINLNRYKAYATMGSTRLIGKLTKDETLDFPIASYSEQNYPFCTYEVAILQGSSLYKYVPYEVGAELNNVKSTSNIFSLSDEQPIFPGGEKALMNFFAQNLKYPTTAAKQGIQGRVILSFVVNRDGSLTDIDEIQSPSPDLTEEAKRVVRMMPKWIPGKQDGKPVRVKYVLPITFRLG